MSVSGKKMISEMRGLGILAPHAKVRGFLYRGHAMRLTDFAAPTLSTLAAPKFPTFLNFNAMSSTQIRCPECNKAFTPSGLCQHISKSQCRRAFVMPLARPISIPHMAFPAAHNTAFPAAPDVAFPAVPDTAFPAVPDAVFPATPGPTHASRVLDNFGAHQSEGMFMARLCPSLFLTWHFPQHLAQFVMMALPVVTLMMYITQKVCLLRHLLRQFFGACVGMSDTYFQITTFKSLMRDPLVQQSTLMSWIPPMSWMPMLMRS